MMKPLIESNNYLKAQLFSFEYLKHTLKHTFSDEQIIHIMALSLQYHLNSLFNMNISYEDCMEKVMFSNQVNVTAYSINMVIERLM